MPDGSAWRNTLGLPLKKKMREAIEELEPAKQGLSDWVGSGRSSEAGCRCRSQEATP